MTIEASPRIVVGIDATPASATGVKYAALEAQRLGAVLDIVHATPGYGDTDGDFPIIDARPWRRTDTACSRMPRPMPARSSRT